MNLSRDAAIRLLVNAATRCSEPDPSKWWVVAVWRLDHMENRELYLRQLGEARMAGDGAGR
ncbi:hypothetical protein ACQPW1_13465 [Nocardia sp. CA-128927]|uniref:hypothetical protein n=1 Tax=Nocardia sp. CA-128927 TaxID=3239975 RepID=UPI003D99CE8A